MSPLPRAARWTPSGEMSSARFATSGSPVLMNSSCGHHISFSCSAAASSRKRFGSFRRRRVADRASGSLGRGRPQTSRCARPRRTDSRGRIRRRPRPADCQAGNHVSAAVPKRADAKSRATQKRSTAERCGAQQGRSRRMANRCWLFGLLGRGLKPKAGVFMGAESDKNSPQVKQGLFPCRRAPANPKIWAPKGRGGCTKDARGVVACDRTLNGTA